LGNIFSPFPTSDLLLHKRHVYVKLSACPTLAKIINALKVIQEVWASRLCEGVVARAAVDERKIIFGAGGSFWFRMI